MHIYHVLFVKSIKAFSDILFQSGIELHHIVHVSSFLLILFGKSYCFAKCFVNLTSTHIIRFRQLLTFCSVLCSFSALHHAALTGTTDLLSLLLEAQATVDIKDSNGETLYHFYPLAKSFRVYFP